MKKIFLLAIGIVLAVLCYREAYVTTVLRYHDRDVYTSYTEDPLSVGKSVRGEIVANHDNLAILKLRIETFNRVNPSRISFMLREKGQSEWQVNNTYAMERMEDGTLFPFGFSPIPGSGGKIYEFEVTGLDGTPANAAGLTNGYHAVATQYVPPKDMRFAQDKLLSMIVDPYMWLYMGLFMIPALGLVVKYRGVLLAYLLLVYAYLPVDMHSNTVLYIAAAGAYLGFLSRTHSRWAYIVGMLCLLEIPFAIAIGNTLAATRAATLVFFSLIVAIAMSFRELKKK